MKIKIETKDTSNGFFIVHRDRDNEKYFVHQGGNCLDSITVKVGNGNKLTYHFRAGFDGASSILMNGLSFKEEFLFNDMDDAIKRAIALNFLEFDEMMTYNEMIEFSNRRLIELTERHAKHNREHLLDWVKNAMIGQEDDSEEEDDA